MQPLPWRRPVALSLVATNGLGGPSAASALVPAPAQAPSQAQIRFRIAATIGPYHRIPESTMAPVVISWTPGSSGTSAGCCTSRIYDNGKLLGQTTRSTFPAVIHVGGFEVGPFEIDSYDAHGVFVGSVIADPRFANQFEDAYIDDHGADCNASGGFSGSWSEATNAAMEGGSSCISTGSGAGFVFQSGVANTWVTSTGPTHGSARIYVDGVYLQTVSTYSPTVHFRRIVWQHRFGSISGHTITIVNAGTPGHSRVDVDADVFLSVD